MKTLAIANHKGGVGKTTTALALAEALAEEYRVLLIDMDPQATLTEVRGVYDFQQRSMADILLAEPRGSAPLAEIVLPYGPNIQLAPADLTLVNASLYLAAQVNREFALKPVVDAEKEKFDICIIDCPPSLNLLTTNALTACDAVLIPAQPQMADLQSLQFFLDSANQVQKEFNSNLAIFGILLTFFDERLNHHQASLRKMRARSMPLLPVTIGRSITVAEALANGRSIISFDQQHSTASNYRKLASLVRDWIMGAPVPSLSNLQG